MSEARRTVQAQAADQGLTAPHAATPAHDVAPVGHRDGAGRDPVAAAVAGTDDPAALHAVRAAAGVDDRLGEIAGDEVVSAEPEDPVRAAAAVDLVRAPVAAQHIDRKSVV